MNMYNKLEQLRDYIMDVDIDDSVRETIVDMIDDMEHDLDVQDSALNYLSDEDDFD